MCPLSLLPLDFKILQYLFDLGVLPGHFGFEFGLVLTKWTRISYLVVVILRLRVKVRTSIISKYVVTFKSNHLTHINLVYYCVGGDNGLPVKRRLYTEEVLSMWNLLKLVHELAMSEQGIASAEKQELIVARINCRVHRAPMNVHLTANNTVEQFY